MKNYFKKHLALVMTIGCIVAIVITYAITWNHGSASMLTWAHILLFSSLYRIIKKRINKDDSAINENK